MTRTISLMLALLVSLSLLAFTAYRWAAASPAKAPVSYAEFGKLYDALLEFRPEGYDRPAQNGPEMYGFDPGLAWGKRNLTAVDREGKLPSQFRQMLISKDRAVGVVIQVMYTETPLPKDMIGVMALPDETLRIGQEQVRIRALPRSLQLFAYQNLVLALEVYQVSDTPVDGDRLAKTGLEVGLALRKLLDQQRYLQ